MLTGYRGAAPVGTTAVEDLLARLGGLAEDLPEVAELDLDPEPDPNLRALPRP